MYQTRDHGPNLITSVRTYSIGAVSGAAALGGSTGARKLGIRAGMFKGHSEAGRGYTGVWLLCGCFPHRSDRMQAME